MMRVRELLFNLNSRHSLNDLSLTLWQVIDHVGQIHVFGIGLGWPVALNLFVRGHRQFEHRVGVAELATHPF